ncbi:MAG: phosphatidate cytidylyltransferase [Candidatus Aegiribacteria sp.]
MPEFKSLASRLAVALPGIGLFVAVALIHSTPLTTAFFAAISAISAWEAVKLLGTGRPGLPGAAAVLTTSGATAAVALLEAELSIAVIFIPGAVTSLIMVIRDGVEEAGRKTAGIIGLTAALSLGFGLLARLRLDFISPWVMFIPLLICWVGDSMAYFVGSAFGNHRMAPSVSPAKSWEGFIAGVAGAVAGALIAGSAGAGFPLPVMLAVGAAGGIAAVAGDLLESAIKRDAGVKDSGTLLQGHGGLLDRFDSILAVVPSVWLLLHLFAGRGGA